jgi:hypothetical protein
VSLSQGMHEIKSANKYRIEDFNKAKDLAQSAAKSGAYLYPIKVSRSWQLWIDLLAKHPLTLHRVSSTSSAIGHYGNPSSPSSPQR